MYNECRKYPIQITTSNANEFYSVLTRTYGFHIYNCVNIEKRFKRMTMQVDYNILLFVD